MSLEQHMTPKALERYSFLWSEARLVIAAIALFLGGVPPIFKILAPTGPVRGLLFLSWVISGIAAGYLLYRWNQAGQKLFGKKDGKDTAAFFVCVVSGLNLGLAALFSRNIGMSLWSGRGIFLAVGILYLVSAAYLYKRWQEHNEKLF